MSEPLMLFNDSKTFAGYHVKFVASHCNTCLNIDQNLDSIAPIAGFFPKFLINKMCSETENKADTDKELRP